MSFVGKGIVAGAAVALILTMVGESTAGAGTVTVPYLCGSPGGGPAGGGDFRVTITAPANASRGQTVTVTASIASVANQTTHTAANTIHLTLDIRLGGAASGTIVATGLTNPDIAPGTPWRVAGGTVQTTLSTAGDVTYRPDRFISGGGVWGCGVRGGAGVAPVAATTHVS